MNDLTVKLLFALLRYELYGEALPDGARKALTPEVLPALYELADQHDLAHLIGDALLKNDLLPEDSPFFAQFEQKQMLAVFRWEQIFYELERICAVLEEARIAFVPLKGAVIRKWYPEPWMRTSCDIDILVSQKDLATAQDALVRCLQYQVKGGCSHDVSLYSPSNVHLELHFSLLENEHLMLGTEALADVWSYVSPISTSSYQMQMSDEILYFYHIAHIAKHFVSGGCGIRFLMDLHILLQNLQLDSAKKQALLAAGGLETFESCFVALAEVWFGKGEMTEELYRLHRHIVSLGIYGNLENMLAGREVTRTKGTFSYLRLRLFPSFADMSQYYPVLKKHKWLLPLFYIFRPFHRLFTTGPRRVACELKVRSNIDDAKFVEQDLLFEMLGVKEKKNAGE